MVRVAAIVFTGLFLGANTWAACGIEPCRTTVRDLVQYPDVYHGKRVRVEGVLNLRFEGHSIRHETFRLSLNFFSPNKDSGEYEREQVARDWARVKTWQRAGLQGRWVEVLAVFDKNETGNFVLDKGGLRDVEAIVPKAAK